MTFQLLFLDEPTSGLDSQASYEIVRFLKKVSFLVLWFVVWHGEPYVMLVNSRSLPRVSLSCAPSTNRPGTSSRCSTTCTC
jgi:ABC-type ATPase involved in cell division